jgi:hypothetical protein
LNKGLSGGLELELVMMKPLAAVLLLTWALPANAADHLVTPAAAERALLEANAQRDRDLAGLDRVFASPAGQRALTLTGADAAQVRGGLATLTDVELRDLAARAAALEADPVAGLSREVNQLLVIFLIVAIVILVLKAVD